MSDTDTLVELTPAAAAKLQTMHDAPSRPMLRLYVEGRTCCAFRYGLAFEESARPDDVVVEARGVDLLVAAEEREPCAGATIDYLETPEGEGFLVQTPASQRGCTCAHG